MDQENLITKDTRPILVVLTGPTAVGKTALSISLAKALNGEIISADSMQVYRKMDIGTAKITPDEMQGVPHHLVDILEPEDEFNVVKFQELTHHAMDEIYAKGKVPILVGGTGFYIQAVTRGIDFNTEEQDDSYRKELEQLAHKNGAHWLHEKLREVDPKAAEQIHENNIKRTIRALEFYHQNGQRISEHNEEQMQHTSPYRLYYFVLTAPRDVLYDRINRRVDQMFEMGLEKEVRELYSEGYRKDLVSMQGLGYKELIDAIEGRCTIEEAKETIKTETRHFAKRQLTWFKREGEVIWVDKSLFDYNDEKALKYMLDIIRKDN